MALLPGKEGPTPQGMITEQITTGTGLFKSDSRPVFDPSKPATAEITIEHVDNINSFVSDVLEPQFYPETAKELPQTEVRTARKPLAGLRKATVIGALLGDF